jgi:hypothetical protein
MARLIAGAGLLVVASVVGGTLIGGALAAANGDATTRDALDAHGPWLAGGAGQYCDVYLDTLASELGVSRDEFLPASKAAATAAIEAAVEAGDLDEERAEQLMERMEGIEQAGCGFIGALGTAFVHGFGHGYRHGFISADVLDAAASALAMRSAELLSEMADGKGLEAIAEGQGVDYDLVKTAIIDALQEDLDAAVAEGLDKQHADTVIERVEAWLDEGGEPGFERPFRRFGQDTDPRGEL